MKWPVVTLLDTLASAEVFVDGDWVESKDQDPAGDVRLIQLADVGDGEYVDKSDRFLTSAKARELRCTFLKPGDVLVARMPDPLGRACIFPGDSKHSVTVVDVCIIRPDSQKHNARWLMHCLNAPDCRNQIAGYATGTTRSRISRGNLGKVRIPVPPLPEQWRIAEILDKADALRAKRRAALAQLDTLTQSIFLDMFGDPATNPKGWPRMAFADVCETRLGKMLDQKKQTGEHRRPYLRNANVQWFRFDLGSLLEMDFDERDRAILQLRPGDLLICEGGEPGRAAVWRGQLDECYFQKALHRARPNIGMATPDYLCWLLWFLAQRETLSGVTSATIAHLTGEKLAVLPTMLPPLALQREFTRHLEAVASIGEANLAAITEFDALFASLQHRAFRGEL